jgi:hypothetical protein
MMRDSLRTHLNKDRDAILSTKLSLRALVAEWSHHL